MSEDPKNTPADSLPGIRIKGMNTDKTRKDTGSETVFHIYFDLSEHPLPEWANIFEKEWQKLNPAPEATVEGSFVVLHCRLEEVEPTWLPVLKKAVAATSEAYGKYAEKEARDLEHREDAWKEERKEVDKMANSLRFD